VYEQPQSIEVILSRCTRWPIIRCTRDELLTSVQEAETSAAKRAAEKAEAERAKATADAEKARVDEEKARADAATANPFRIEVSYSSKEGLKLSGFFFGL